MASTDPLPSAARKQIAEQAARFLPRRPAGPAAGPAGARAAAPKLAEDFARCIVSVQDVEHPPADLAALLEPTGNWLHTIRQGRSATHLAVSQAHRTGTEKHEVIGMFEGELAKKIDAAVRWLDEHDKDERATVRLLDFPAYYTFAFGIIRKRKLSAVLVHQPDTFTRLQYEKEYSLKDFLAKLAQEPHT